MANINRLKQNVTITSLPLVMVSPQTKCNGYNVTVSNGLCQFVISYLDNKITKLSVTYYIVTCPFQNMIITY
jgi:hypothetical protein